jgi:hypothetical protein
MSDQDFTTVITVDQSPEKAFAAVLDVRGWWSEGIVGDAEKLGDEFVFHVRDVHKCTMTLTELVPGRKVVWHVSDSWIGFVSDTSEWNDTDVVFEVSEKDGRTEVRFTHLGLVPAIECFDGCSQGWGFYVTGSLKSLITTGQGDPHKDENTLETELLKHQKHREMAA